MHVHELSLEIDIGTLEVDTQPAVCLVVMQQMGPFNKNIIPQHKPQNVQLNAISSVLINLVLVISDKN